MALTEEEAGEHSDKKETRSRADFNGKPVLRYLTMASSIRALAVCAKPLSRQGTPLWDLDKVLDTEGGVHDTTTPTHAGKSQAAQLLRTHDPSARPGQRACEPRNG